MEITSTELEGIKLYRLTNEDEKHNGFQYHDGLNVDTEPFNPVGDCEPGGLYFFCEESLHTFPQNVNMDTIEWIREVTLLPDSRIYKMKDKFKTDKFFLGPRSNFGDFLESNPKIWLAAVQQDEWALHYVKKQTSEICLAAVQQNGYILRYVKEQTPDICLAAVQQNGYALEYVKKQTYEICLAAVKQNGYALEYVEKQTSEICLAAVQQNGLALRFVKEQTPNICLAAVQQNGYALHYVKKENTRNLFW